MITKQQIFCRKKYACLALSLAWGLRRTLIGRASYSNSPPSISNTTTTATSSLIPSSAGADLRIILRRYPYWREGHRLLAEACLAEGDIATAYASTHCFSALASPDNRAQSQLHFLMGRCFLRCGDPERSLQHLTVAQQYDPTSCAIIEEQAAAHMLMGNKAQALALLSRVPEKKLTPEAIMTRSYLQRTQTE